MKATSVGSPEVSGDITLRRGSDLVQTSVKWLAVIAVRFGSGAVDETAQAGDLVLNTSFDHIVAQQAIKARQERGRGSGRVRAPHLPCLAAVES